MGRLTLNVLLSFAQFEREVTGERVRDKIAASKRKGLWVGGPVPLTGASARSSSSSKRIRTLCARGRGLEGLGSPLRQFRAWAPATGQGVAATAIRSRMARSSLINNVNDAAH
jgi:site-specific DNA recombinase